MHEHALMRDLVARIEATAEAEGATRVTRVTVQLGALSHFTPHHFREHFEDATRAPWRRAPRWTPSSRAT